MQQQQPETATEEALEAQYGVEPSRPYSLRADQLEDGTYRYALEEAGTGTILAEGVHEDEQEALARFHDNLAQSGLSPDEIAGLQRAADDYEAAV